MPVYARLASDYLAAALPLGLQVRRCEEPRVPSPLLGHDGVTLYDGVRLPDPVPGDPPYIWSLDALAVDATNAAWRGKPSAIIWHFQLPAGPQTPMILLAPESLLVNRAQGWHLRARRSITNRRCAMSESTQRESTEQGAWPEAIAAITLFVEDLEAAKRFYQEVFELPVVFEDDNSTVFRFGETLVNLLRTSEAPELVEPASVATPDAGVRFQFTLGVDDVDGRCKVLKERGVELLNGPMDRPWGIRTASFRDPGGHIWEIAN